MWTAGTSSFSLWSSDRGSILPDAPMEMIFVLDCSGSMSGKPIAKAKQAITRALKKLQPDDTFQVIRFSNSASQFGPDPVPATTVSPLRFPCLCPTVYDTKPPSKIEPSAARLLKLLNL